jgi:hypothetical protein
VVIASFALTMLALLAAALVVQRAELTEWAELRGDPVLARGTRASYLVCVEEASGAGPGSRPTADPFAASVSLNGGPPLGETAGPLAAGVPGGGRGCTRVAFVVDAAARLGDGRLVARVTRPSGAEILAEGLVQVVEALPAAPAAAPPPLVVASSRATDAARLDALKQRISSALLTTAAALIVLSGGVAASLSLFVGAAARRRRRLREVVRAETERSARASGHAVADTGGEGRNDRAAAGQRARAAVPPLLAELTEPRDSGETTAVGNDAPGASRLKLVLLAAFLLVMTGALAVLLGALFTS